MNTSFQKQFERGEILSYPNVHIDMNGVAINFHALAIEGWDFKIRRKHPTGCLRMTLWQDRYQDSRKSCLSFKIRRAILFRQRDLTWDWHRFFDNLSAELAYSNNYISFSNRAVFTFQAPAKTIAAFSTADLLDELALRYPKPVRKPTKPESNVVDITAIRQKLQKNFEQDMEVRQLWVRK